MAVLIVFYIIIMFNLLIGLDTLPSNKFKNYCGMRCGDHQHIVCRRYKERCSEAPNCPGVEHPDMTNEFRQAILDYHNVRRNEIASQKQGWYPATNMKALNWHYELEFIAQCTANACNYDLFDPCKRTSEFDVKQNRLICHNAKYFDKYKYLQHCMDFYWFKPGITHWNNIHDLNRWHKYSKYSSWMWGWKYTGSFDFDYNTTTSTKTWYQSIAQPIPPGLEIDNFNHTNRTNLPQLFGNMIWADMEYIGCGKKVYRDYGGKKKLHLYCNYAGYEANIAEVGNRTYIRGPPCTVCGGRKCNEKYTSLCGETYPVAEIYPGHFILGSSDISPSKYLIASLLVCTILIQFYI